jgi:hypothetical protein
MKTTTRDVETTALITNQLEYIKLIVGHLLLTIKEREFAMVSKKEYKTLMKEMINAIKEIKDL